MKTTFLLLLLTISGLFAAPSLAEEDYEIEDAHTKKSSLATKSGRFEGLFLETNLNWGSKELSISFLFSEEPSYGITYFSFYDSTIKAIVLDFYDSFIGESILDSIQEFPIQSCKVEQYKVDLNKGISGLKPDYRDVVRIKLFSDYDIPIRVFQNNFNVIQLSLEWNDDIRKSLTKKDNSIYWKIPMAVFLMTGIGWGTTLLY